MAGCRISTKTDFASLSKISGEEKKNDPTN